MIRNIINKLLNWWNGTPTELSMKEVYELEGEYKDKLVKSKSSILAHKPHAFFLNNWFKIFTLLIALSAAIALWSKK